MLRTTADHVALLTADIGERLASQEVANLMARLEPTLTKDQSRLMDQLRLAAESLGAARMSLRICRP